MRLKKFHPLFSLVLVPLIALTPSLAEDIPSILQVHAVSNDGSTVDAGGHSAKGFSIDVTDANGSGVSDAAVLLRLPDSNATGKFADGTHAAIAYTDGAGHATIGDIHWGVALGVVPITITATKGAAHAGTLMEETIGHVSAAKPVKPVAHEAEAKIAAPVIETASAVQQPGKPATADASSAPLTPLRPAPVAPSVSVVNTNTHEKFDSGSSHTKWYIIAAVVAAGAGAGFFFATKKSSSSSSSSASAITIGAPTVSVGAP